jgi:hypothetical protein
MKMRKLHRLMGLVMLLPLCGWAVTGLIFFIKPGYDAAYETLPVRTLPMDSPLTLKPDAAWKEIRSFKTILGDHLLVRTENGWQQLDSRTLMIKAKPDSEQIKKLMQDAFTANPGRYGAVASVNDLLVITTTGINVTLDWNRMSLHQAGKDTSLIDWLYKIHYLQWTGIKWIDRILGMTGIALIVGLSILGLMLSFNGSSWR